MQMSARSVIKNWSDQPANFYLPKPSNCEYFNKFGETNGRLSMVYQDLQDAELLERMKQGDSQAFDQLYKRYWNVLYKSAWYRLRDEEACLDLLQEIFTWFWAHRSMATDINNVKTYLLAAIKFKIANLIKHKKVRENFFSRAEQLQAEQYTQAHDLETKELKIIIEQFTEELPVKCRQVFRLSRNGFFSNREIASQLSISEKTVENQITIALGKLRALLRRLA